MMSTFAEFRDHQRPKLEALLKDPSAFLADMKEKAENKFKLAADTNLKARCDEFLHLKEEDRKRIEQRKVFPPKFGSEIRPVPLYLEDCGLISWKPVFEKLTHVQSFEELVKILDLKNPREFYSAMGLNIQTVDPNSFLRKYLKPVSEGQQIMNVLDSERESREVQLKDIEAANWAIIGAIPDGQNLGWRNIRLLLWPYFVLTALGLKLARVRYCGDLSID